MQTVIFLQLPKSEDLLHWKLIFTLSLPVCDRTIKQMNVMADINNLGNFAGVSPAQLAVAAGILLRPRSDPPLLYEASLERGRGQGPRCEALFFHQGQR